MRMQSDASEEISSTRTLLLSLTAVLMLVILLLFTHWMGRTNIPVIELREVSLVSPAALPEPSIETVDLLELPPLNLVPPPPALELEVSTEPPVMPTMAVMTPSLDVTTAMADFALNQPSLDVQALADPKQMPKPVVIKRTLTLPHLDPQVIHSKPSPKLKQHPPSPIHKSRLTPQTVSPKPTPKPSPPSSAHSSYGVGELDKKPQLLTKNPKARFPRTLLKAGVTNGSAILNIEIDTSGRVKVLSFSSISHPELKAMAMQVARKARFTRPTKNGKPVKAGFRWPLTLRK